MSFDLKILAGDLVIDKSDLKIVKGSEKLQQDMLKISITEAGANPLHPWYGSLISKTLIGNVLPNEITVSAAKTQLQNAIETLKNLQNFQISQGQKLTADEQIAFIKDISIFRDANDPRIFNILIRVLNRVFGQVSVVFKANNT